MSIEKLQKELGRHRDTAMKSDSNKDVVMELLEAVSKYTYDSSYASMPILKHLRSLRSAHDDEISALAKSIYSNWKSANKLISTRKESSPAPGDSGSSTPTSASAASPAAHAPAHNRRAAPAASDTKAPRPAGAAYFDSDQISADRNRIARAIYTSLSRHHDWAQISNDRLVKFSHDLEGALANEFQPLSDAYKSRMRALALDLGDANNEQLRNRIWNDPYCTPAYLVTAKAQDLASDSMKEQRKLRLEKTRNELHEAKGIDMESDDFLCPRCGKKRVRYSQQQTRSADEPMTTFITCLECGHKWKE
ncbi:hypothetical protein H696_03551 [Fonticula alba]|uniref:TFIIS-type domain-containing protein n=1 Tax=Fonticula alba TaxID=691883 RepID=A0A058Z729_FONAL|nr:hypothetical protein H696_03551 [Fonticula alba]KCV70089.1 hypothetical protein H696_03551 [Fonticula alba]|eukprot:XP_009495695.1 hypothetical protein H696_03551 [Fonticula alba]